MTVTQHLGIVFARPKLRIALLVVVLVHGVLGLMGTVSGAIDQVTGGVTLTYLADFVQFLLIQAAITFLYLNSSKSEKTRYSLDTGFYLKFYAAEQNRWLWLDKTSANAKVGLTAKNVAEGRQDKMVLSQSVLQYLPSKPLSIADVKFELDDEWYELPWFVADHALDQTLRRFNALEKHDYNGLTLSLKNIQPSAEQLTLRFRKSNYYSYLATNMLPEARLPGGLSYRDVLEPGPALHNPDVAIAENHVGLSCLMLTTDNHLLIPVRKKTTNVFKGQLSPSVSGAGNIPTCFDDTKNVYTPLAWLAQETSEELPFLQLSVANLTAFPEDIRSLRLELQSACFLGMSRELRRCGKPELFFSYQLPWDAAHVRTLQKGHERTTNEQSENESHDIQAIDLNENESYLLVRADTVYASLNSKTEGRPRETSVRLTLGNSSYVVSESLLVNLILLRHHGVG
ncbi:hypothetical protein CWE12_08545 [Aliidiomarina sedimenti]|uniref:Uncharacterized protein n=1 Tax=Aliidiomarina sedimenti TaxID=1933879 RepID=A0ABY0BZC7_9GAMM|nr:hypothetical protein [Aliidiomarina sedimenti]RUO29999.1 hypothetical protein CWE12_08545 [Aliidiomarina sedimenti]